MTDEKEIAEEILRDMASEMAERDTFAAHALTGIMAKVASTTMPSGSREAIAKLAYQMADAMLCERERARLQ